MTRPATSSSQWTEEHYEAIRQWFLARPRPNSAPSGAALLLLRGMAAWLLTGPAEDLTSNSQAQAANSESFNLSTRLRLNAHGHGKGKGKGKGKGEVSLALVLATMVEQARMEVVR